MKREASETQASCHTQHQLNEDICALMVSLEKQNVLLSGYYDEIIKSRSLP